MTIAMVAALPAVLGLSAVSAVLTAPSAFAAANAVIPTSPNPGTSTSVINNYVQVGFPANDDGTWPCGGDGNASPPCPGPDGQTGPTLYPIGFNINFFGTQYNSAYTNNNGNITFAQPLPEYTPQDLTSFGSPIIAPFFADVDTRGPASATVNFGTGTLNGQKVFVVNWPGVGCFDTNSSVLDNFQMILIDRADRGTGPLGDDFDMEFNYNSMQWDTGQASGGDANCLDSSGGGVPAYVGYSNGSSTPGDSFNLPGSGVAGALLDTNMSTGLIFNDLNSTTLGRYIFTVNNGQPTQPTTTTTSLSGGGQSGTTIAVDPGTAVTDSATLTGSNAASAGGTVTYDVYSDAACQNAVSSGSPEHIMTPGQLPPSSPVSFSTPGAYYWEAFYSGDGTNNGSNSGCGGEVETVNSHPTCYTGPWPSAVNGYPVVHPVSSGRRFQHSPQGVYVGEVNDAWIVTVTHTGSGGQTFTGTITTTNGTFANLKKLENEGHDRVTLVTPSEITFRFINRGYLDGVGFTSTCGDQVTISATINGPNASPSQIFLGPALTHPASSPVTFTRTSALNVGQDEMSPATAQVRTHAAHRRRGTR